MYTTKVHIEESKCKISYQDKIITLGSCFSENIGKKLDDTFFQVDLNPFGVLYNPVSIRNSVQYLIRKRQFDETDLFQNGSLWHSFSHSSLFSDVDKASCLKRINSRMNVSTSFLKDARFLLITFGTAWVYELKNGGEVVSNCHKLPAKEFVRYRLSLQDIVADYEELIGQLNLLFPDLKIIFTVSPIRHWKDGAHENNVNKGILLQAIDELWQQFENVSYFPAYEIMLDELRDYRYYASDMLHPSDVAVNYIWQRFTDVYLSATTRSLKKELEQYRADLLHRPLHRDSAEFQNFLENTNKKGEELVRKYPFLAERIVGVKEKLK